MGEKTDEEIDAYKELVKLDMELNSMMEKDPDLVEVYCSEMDEEPGEVVLLPRVPTAEDWARAEELARSREKSE